jgi:hypothetical protein
VEAYLKETHSDEIRKNRREPELLPEVLLETKEQTLKEERLL